jgi:serine/threonine protein kinase
MEIVSGGVQHISEASFGGAADLGLTSLREIGRGATSTVFAGRQEKYGRDIAIKVFATPLTDDKARRRFERECKILGQLSVHPNVVNLFGSGFDGAERPFIVMDLCDRGSLQHQLVSSGPMSVPDVLRIGVKISSALEFAHRSGVLHRDIKPANVLRTAWNEPLLTDFGISGDTHDEMSWTIGESLTPLYAAPEVLEEGGGSVASDVWSLGSTLYALLLGKAPFSDTTSSLVAMVNRIIERPAPALGRDDVPPALLAILNEAMAKRPADRPDSAGALARRLQHVQRDLWIAATEFVELDPAQPPVGDVPDARDGAASMDVLPPTVNHSTVVRSRSASDPTPPAELADSERTKASAPSPPADLDATMLRRPTVATDPGPREDLLAAATRRPGPLKQSRRRWAVMAAIIACGIVVSTVVLTSGGSKQAAPTAQVAALPIASITSVRCEGQECHYTVASDGVPNGALLSVSFGDGTTRGESAGSFTHRYPKLSHFVVSAAWTQGGKSGTAITVPVSLRRFTRTMRLTSGHATSHRLLTRVRGSARCQTGRFEVDRRTHGAWHAVGRMHKVGKSGVTHVVVPTSGRYRVAMAANDAAGGRCSHAAATHTVTAVHHSGHSTPTTSITTTTSTSTSSGTYTSTPTHHASQPKPIKPTVGPPPPAH